MSVLSPEINIGEPGRFAPWGAEPGRLWSLWDMLELDAQDFLTAVTTSERVRVLVQENADGTLKGPIDKDMRDEASEHWKLLLDSVIGMEVIGCAELIKRGLRHLGQKDEITYDDIGRVNGEIFSRLHDELVGRKFIHLNNKWITHYSSGASIFGAEVAAKFSSLVYEIEESAKCLAFERSTACVFHSIRCFEGAITALSRCLGIPDPTKGAERSWSRVAHALKGEIDKRWPANSPDRMSGDGQFFEEAYAYLVAIQNPWRNSTMHLDQKYTMDEANLIFDAVGNFMKRLASRMDEQGEPKA